MHDIDLPFLTACIRCGGYNKLVQRWSVDSVLSSNGPSSFYWTVSQFRSFDWPILLDVMALLLSGRVETALREVLIAVDICSSMGGSSEESRFVDFVENNLRKFENGNHGVDVYSSDKKQNKATIWTGHLCWQLRNMLVHGDTRTLQELVNTQKSYLKTKYKYHYVDLVFTNAYCDVSTEFLCQKDGKVVRTLLFELSVPLLVMKLVCICNTFYVEHVAKNPSYFSNFLVPFVPSFKPFDMTKFFGCK